MTKIFYGARPSPRFPHHKFQNARFFEGPDEKATEVVIDGSPTGSLKEIFVAYAKQRSTKVFSADDPKALEVPAVPAEKAGK